jgi:hypothetical protein
MEIHKDNILYYYHNNGVKSISRFINSCHVINNRRTIRFYNKLFQDVHYMVKNLYKNNPTTEYSNIMIELIKNKYVDHVKQDTRDDFRLMEISVVCIKKICEYHETMYYKYKGYKKWE